MFRNHYLWVDGKNMNQGIVAFITHLLEYLNLRFLAFLLANSTLFISPPKN